MEALACLVCDFQSFLGFNNESAERRREERVAYGRVLWARPGIDTHTHHCSSHSVGQI